MFVEKRFVEGVGAGVCAKRFVGGVVAFCANILEGAGVGGCAKRFVVGGLVAFCAKRFVAGGLVAGVVGAFDVKRFVVGATGGAEGLSVAAAPWKMKLVERLFWAGATLTGAVWTGT